MTIAVRLLQANHGDCILVSHTSEDKVFNLLIDGGNPATFSHGPRLRYKGELRLVLDEMKEKNQSIDLAILTHIDDDHIGGMLRAFETPGYLCDMVKNIWFNSSKNITDHFNHIEIPANNIPLKCDDPETSIKQGKTLEGLLKKIGCEQSSIIKVGQIINKGPFKFTILSPSESNLQKLLCLWPHEGESSKTAGTSTDYSLSFEEIWNTDKFQEDESISNGSSIAFILEADGKAMLFLGDAHNKTVVESLGDLKYCKDNKLKLDLVKMSHHGSKHNTSKKLLEMLDVEKYLI